MQSVYDVPHSRTNIRVITKFMSEKGWLKVFTGNVNGIVVLFAKNKYKDEEQAMARGL